MNSEDIDWGMTPAEAFRHFECRGDMNRIRSSRERCWFFYIDNWGETPVLCLMERGIRHARVAARLEAPQKLLAACIAEQGASEREKSYAVNNAIRVWLEENVLGKMDGHLPCSVKERGKEAREDRKELPDPADVSFTPSTVLLRQTPQAVAEDELPAIIREYDFFESVHNPAGRFTGFWVDSGDGHTVTDLVTGLTWQLAGNLETCSMVRLRRFVEQANSLSFANATGWRLPTLPEALSLLRPEKNENGLHIHPCFDSFQAFIYTADTHKPGGYWFVDFRQARVFWAGGTLAGGFGRLVRQKCVRPL